MSHNSFSQKEQGVTLVELLAAITITTLIGLIAYSVLFSGFKTYERVKAEDTIRDEADVIMVQLISSLYTEKEADITKKVLNDNESGNSYLEFNGGEQTGFYNGLIYIKGEAISVLQSDDIILHKDSKMNEVDQGQYEIILALEHVPSGRKMVTQSEVSLIRSSD